MEINKLEKNNNLELDNKIKNNKTQKDFLESALGKTINTAIDIGIRSILPEFIDERIVAPYALAVVAPITFWYSSILSLSPWRTSP